MPGRRGHNKRQDDDNQSEQQSRIADSDNKSSNNAVQELEVDSYKNLKKREVVGDDLEHDHIPSAQAVIRAEEKRRREKLSPREKQEVYDNATAVERTKDSHKQSRTYAGKNTQKQTDHDSDDLAGAACRDCDSFKKTEIGAGKSPVDVDRAIDKIHDRNVNELNIYTNKQLHKAKESLGNGN